METSGESRAQFLCNVHPSGARIVVEARGEVDIGNVATLDELLHHVLGLGVPRLVIDVRAVTFLDVGGARVLLEAGERAAASGTACSLVLTEGPVARLLRLLGAEITTAPTASSRRRCGGRSHRAACSVAAPDRGRRMHHPRSAGPRG